jgi:hypothetical protein
MNLKEYLLTKTIEECGEIIQACTKALCFGLDDKHPLKGNVPNRQLIACERDDLLGILEMLQERKLIPPPSPARIGLKQAKVRRWMKYSRKVGTLKGN